MSWYLNAAAAPNEEFRELARQRQQQLTKPAGSLGRLEALAIKLAALQQTKKPSCGKVSVCIFAGDHGIVAEGVSAYPQAVTGQMLANFAEGGAAISVLAKSLRAKLTVINLGTATDATAIDGVVHKPIAPGTANFTERAAMSESQLQQALAAGKEAVADAGPGHLWIGGEMGIGNTTSATALACAHLNLPAATLVGPGTGLDNAGQIHKADVIDRALSLFSATAQAPLKDLQYLGGLEIAALVGSFIAAAQAGIAVLVDGYICSVAALYAVAINPSIKPWLFYAHLSREPGHKKVLEALNADPLLRLGMALGEGSGAATAVPLLRMACDLHNKMATFEQAHVDQKSI